MVNNGHAMWRSRGLGKAVAVLLALCGGIASEAASAGGWQVPEEPALVRLLDRVAVQPRPRSWPRTPEILAVEAALKTGERQPAFERLVRRVETERARLGPAGLQAQVAAGLSVLRQKQLVDGETRQAQSAAFVWLTTGAAEAGVEARSRARLLAVMPADGATGVARDMLSARHIVWTLALVLDWMGDSLPGDERASLVRAVTTRMEDFHRILSSGPAAFEAWPWDSRANEVLGALAETSLLMLGETPRARVWAQRFVPLYLGTTLVWAGEDGGYASGTAYAGWDVGEYSLRHWDALRRMTGIDPAEKPWAQNFGRFLVYFLPPGTPGGLFGDGAESYMPEVWARYAKAYTARVPHPLYRWYARQWFQEDASALELLTAPDVAFDQAEPPAGTSDSAAFPSVGWAAMHSNLKDRGRVSVYFKSSPYGSINHSHADQNSFVLNAGGRVLLADSGYYDDYNSPHQLQWARQTQAHNAVTYDGGRGQKLNSLAARGRLADFVALPGLDWVTGDATTAYGWPVTRALRSVAYVRPDLVLVFDSLEAERPLRWEINLHAEKAFLEGEAGEVLVRNGDGQACVRTYADSPLTFRQWTGFPAPPARDARQPRPDQAHARYTVDEAHRRLAVVQVIRVNCRTAPPVVRFGPEGGASVGLAGGLRIDMDAAGKLALHSAERTSQW